MTEIEILKQEEREILSEMDGIRIEGIANCDRIQSELELGKSIKDINLKFSEINSLKEVIDRLRVNMDKQTKIEEINA